MGQRPVVGVLSVLKEFASAPLALLVSLQQTLLYTDTF